MKALGWVATMRSGHELPFAIRPVLRWTERERFDKLLEDVSRAGVSRITPGQVQGPLFEIRGTVTRPLLRGGHLTKLVLRACPPSR